MIKTKGNTLHTTQTIQWTNILLPVLAIALWLCIACSTGQIPTDPQDSRDTTVPNSFTQTPEVPKSPEIPGSPTAVRLSTSAANTTAQKVPQVSEHVTQTIQPAPRVERHPEPDYQQPNVPDTVERVRPAVVSVLAHVVTTNSFNKDTRSTTGTGTIITRDGLVLTNNHVIENSKNVSITLDDRTLLDAQVVGADRLSDLAVLRLPHGNYPFLPLRNNVQTRPGQWVIAIGNALALPGGPTVTVGVISALGRSREAIGGTTLNDLIQTDTVMNSGNSGGPLINLNGEIVGVNTAVLRSKPGQPIPVEGIGFAVNMETAVLVTRQLINQGRVHWAYMGVGLGDLSQEAASSAGLTSRKGALVSAVSPGSPADRAGVIKGDIILSLQGNPTNTAADVLRLLRQELRAGQTVEIEVQRNRAILNLEIILGERPPK